MTYLIGVSDVADFLLLSCPEALMLIFIYLLLLFGIFKIASTDAYSMPKMHIISVIIICAAIYLVYYSGDGYSELMDRSSIDSIVELFILFVSLCVFLSTYSYNKVTGILTFEYYVVMLLCICSFCMFIHANDILLMYVLIELQSIGSYILASINRNSRSSVEAGIKYFILGSLSSILLLLGFSFLYGFSGMVSIYDLSVYMRFIYTVNDTFYVYGMLLSIIFINIGFLFKIYSAPVHFWVADVYHGAPTSVTMYMATIPVISYAYVFVKLYICVFSELSTFYTYVLYILSISSMAFGVFGAMVQRRIKRLIAYSSVGTVGYVVAGIAGNSILLTQQSLLYILIYILNIVPVFILAVNYRMNNVHCLDSIRHFSSLYWQNGFVFALLSLFLFSLAGVPPLSGFFGKLLLFTAFGADGMFIVLAISISFTLVGCFYYIRIVKGIFFDSNESRYFYASTSYWVVWALCIFALYNISMMFTYHWYDNICLLISIGLYSGTGINNVSEL